MNISAWLSSWVTEWLSYNIEQSPSWQANGSSACPEIACILWNLKVYYSVHDWCHPSYLVIIHLILSSHLWLGQWKYNKVIPATKYCSRDLLVPLHSTFVILCTVLLFCQQVGNTGVSNFISYSHTVLSSCCKKWLLLIIIRHMQIYATVHYKPDTITTATLLYYTLHHKILHSVQNVRLVSNHPRVKWTICLYHLVC